MPDSVSLHYKEYSILADTSQNEVPVGLWNGVAGDPIPYALRSDDVITLLLIACFIVSMVSISNSWSFVVRQTKSLFREQHEGVTIVSETASEVRFQLVLLLQTALLYSIFQYFYTIENVGNSFILNSQYMLIGVFFAVILFSFFFRAMLYTLVNNVFFDSKQNKDLLLALLFISSMEGVLVYPVALLQVYLNLPLQNVVFYVVAVLVLVKFLTFYKCFVIFFKRLGGFLQIFLYFCTLEIAPLITLWGILVLIGNYLKINF